LITRQLYHLALFKSEKERKAGLKPNEREEEQLIEGLTAYVRVKRRHP